MNLEKRLKDAAKSLWKGSSPASKLVGRGLVISAAASTVLGLLNVKRGYKIDTKPSKESN